MHGEVEAAAERIGPWVRATPAQRSRWLSERTGADVWLKLECWQRTGSFKLRGATNRLRVDPAAVAGGVVAASTGNHGLGVAAAAADLGIGATVFVPEDADPGKVAAIRWRGADVRVAGEDCVDTEAVARAWADREGRTYVSPYNDRHVAAGQGTVARELCGQVPELDAVFASLGGGGLIGGMAGWLRTGSPGTAMVAVSPAHSAVMHHSLAAGRILDLPSLPTLSGATAGGVEPGSITFGLCQGGIDRSIVVEEADIAEALRGIAREEHVLVEGAAALAVAGLLQDAAAWRGRRVAVVLCGANLDRAGWDALRA